MGALLKALLGIVLAISAFRLWRQADEKTSRSRDLHAAPKMDTNVGISIRLRLRPAGC
jgi:hypothetical protein